LSICGIKSSKDKEGECIWEVVIEHLFSHHAKDIEDACNSMKDMDEIMALLETSDYGSDTAKVCGYVVPDIDDVFSRITFTERKPVEMQQTKGGLRFAAIRLTIEKLYINAKCKNSYSFDIMPMDIERTEEPIAISLLRCETKKLSSLEFINKYVNINKWNGELFIIAKHFNKKYLLYL